MSTVKYNSSSPYAVTPQASWFLGNYVHRPIIPHGTDQPYTIPPPYANRPDLAAYALYSDSRLWWIFAVRNPALLKDPLYDFNEGLVIQVPTKEHLVEILG